MDNSREAFEESAKFENLPKSYLDESQIEDETERTISFLSLFSEFIDNASINRHGEIFLNPGYELRQLERKYSKGSVLRALNNSQFREAFMLLRASIGRFQKETYQCLFRATRRHRNYVLFKPLNQFFEVISNTPPLCR